MCNNSDAQVKTNAGELKQHPGFESGAAVDHADGLSHWAGAQAGTVIEVIATIQGSTTVEKPHLSIVPATSGKGLGAGKLEGGILPTHQTGVAKPQ